jgi:Holliday junction DNA helicase RuvA
LIAFLRGSIVEKHPNRIVVDVNGVGYEVFVPLSTFYGLGEPGSQIAVRIHTHVREDALLLYGFGTLLEQELFERLIGIGGIGPKLALAVLSGIEPLELVRAIERGDVARLTAIPGVGKKTSERIVLELKDRLPRAQVAAVGSRSRSSITMRSAVFLPTPGMLVRRARSDCRMARMRSAGSMPESTPSATFGPMPLMPISRSKSVCSSSAAKPKS